MSEQPITTSDASAAAPTPPPVAPPASAAPRSFRPKAAVGVARGYLSVIFTLGNVLTVLAVLFALAFSAALTVGLQLYAAAKPTKSAYVTTPTALGYPYEAVSFPAEGGLQVSGWFVPAPVQSDAAILVLHGYGSNKSEMLPRVGFLSQYYSLLFIDFRYFGESGGEYSTLGVREIGEARAALAWLEERGFKSVGLYGFSMGGTVALRSLAEDELTRCAALESPYGDLRLVFHDAYRTFGPLHEQLTDLTAAAARVMGFDYRDALPPEVAGVRSPVLLFASRTDQVVPFEHVEAVAALLADDREMETVFFEGKQHGEIPPGFTERMLSFFGACLGGDAL